MITIRKAAEADCRTIRRLAETAFPAAYRAILSPPQIAYMLEWMYAEPELLRQMRDGHVYYLALDEGVPCSYVSVERQAPISSICSGSTCFPPSRAGGSGPRCSDGPWPMSARRIRLRAGWS